MFVVKSILPQTLSYKELGKECHYKDNAKLCQIITTHNDTVYSLCPDYHIVPSRNKMDEVYND
jgi:hypothetical protein